MEIDIKCFNLTADLEYALINYTHLKISLICNKYDIIWKNILEFIKPKILCLVNPNLRSNVSHIEIGYLENSENLNAETSLCEIKLWLEFCLNIIEHSYKYEESTSCSVSFGDYMNLLNDVVLCNTLFENQLHNSVAEICFKILEQNHTNMTTQFVVKTLAHFLNTNLRLSKLVDSNVKKSIKIISYLSNLNNIDDELFNILKYPIKSVISSNVLFRLKMGIELMTHLICLDQKIVILVREEYLEILVKCKPNKVKNYAQIIHCSWEMAPVQTKQFIEQNFLLYYMKKGLTCNWIGNKRREFYRNVHKLLSFWHGIRKENFSRIITSLYDPLIFTYLRSDIKHFRLNAIEILMDAYPLEKPRSSLTVYSECLLKQHKEMLKRLEDECPVIRCITIKKICSNLKYFWDTFQNGTVEKILKLLTEVLINDASSSEVRRSVLKGLTVLLDNEKSFPMLKNILPNLKKHFNDGSKYVRQSYILLLQKIKDTKDLHFHYWELMGIHEVNKKLCQEDTTNIKLLLKLVFDSFYTPTIPTIDACYRIIKFLSINPFPAQEFAKNSSIVLPFEGAYDIICMMFILIKKVFKAAFPKASIENSTTNATSVVTKNENTSTAMTNEIITTNETTSIVTTNETTSIVTTNENTSEVTTNEITSSQTPNTRATDLLGLQPLITDINILHGLLDYIVILWMKHSKKLNESENDNKKERLHNLASRVVPILLLRYRETKVLYGAINLASMLPLYKLSSTTTITGLCMSILRNIRFDQDLREINLAAHALLVWKRGRDIIELVSEWIDQAFRIENLNESMHLHKKVKFDRPPVNPDAALTILDAIIQDPLDKTALYNKNKQIMLDFYEFLKRTKILVDRRIAKEAPLHNTMLTDRFLNRLFYIYIKMPLCFHLEQYEEYKDVNNVLNDILEWSENHILQKATVCHNELGDSMPFEISLIISLFKLNLNIIALNISNACSLQCIKFTITAYSKYGNSNLAIYFVEYLISIAYEATISLDQNIKDVNQDHILECIPEILKTVMDTIGRRPYCRDEFIRYNLNINNINKKLVRLCYQLTEFKNLSGNNVCDKVLYEICETILNLLWQIIKESQIVPLANNISKLPFLVSNLTSLLVFNKSLSREMMVTMGKVITNQNNDGDISIVTISSLLYTLSCVVNRMDINAFKLVFDFFQASFQNGPFETRDTTYIFSLGCINNENLDNTLLVNSAEGAMCSNQQWGSRKIFNYFMRLIKNNLRSVSDQFDV